ncbi:MAG: regulatory protein RecX [Oscillospiraceae bacterium]
MTEHRLYNGAELDDAACRGAAPRFRPRALARDRALGMVSRRMYSRKELRDKLVQKGEDADTAAYCADWLAEHGFINDETYAAAIVRHYAAKNLGVSRIRMELSRRGISRELWEDALAEMPENGRLSATCGSTCPIRLILRRCAR